MPQPTKSRAKSRKKAPAVTDLKLTKVKVADASRAKRSRAKTDIVRITLEYTDDGGTYEVVLDGNETWAVFTDRALAEAFGTLIGQKPAGRPPNGHGPKRAPAAPGLRKPRRQQGAARPLAEEPPPECCYYVNGKWYCW